MNESPEQAVRRELLEELGAEVIALNLLHIEYQLQEHDDVFHFIYEATINLDLISLNKEELKSHQFFDLKEVKSMLLPRLFERISFALNAKGKNQVLYRETSV